MTDYKKYFDANKKLWDHKTPIHIGSDFYDNEAFLAGASTLKKIEINGLGDVTGKKIIHLQCHFGQDSMTLARMGADVTGVDLSSSSIKHATETSQKLGLDCHFIEGNVYDVLDLTSEQYDIVFVTYGAICWLPDLDIWADRVSKLLKKGGKLYMVEFHPYLYTFDWPSKKPAYHYFNLGQYHEVEKGTYADQGADIALDEYFWIHPISDVINSILGHDMKLDLFNEYDYSPYNCFENTTKRAEDEYVFDIGISCPHTFELQAEKLT